MGFQQVGYHLLTKQQPQKHTISAETGRQAHDCGSARELVLGVTHGRWSVGFMCLFRSGFRSGSAYYLCVLKQVT